MGGVEKVSFGVKHGFWGLVRKPVRARTRRADSTTSGRRNKVNRDHNSHFIPLFRPSLYPMTYSPANRSHFPSRQMGFLWSNENGSETFNVAPYVLQVPSCFDPVGHPGKLSIPLPLRIEMHCVFCGRKGKHSKITPWKYTQIDFLLWSKRDHK